MSKEIPLVKAVVTRPFGETYEDENGREAHVQFREGSIIELPEDRFEVLKIGRMVERFVDPPLDESPLPPKPKPNPSKKSNKTIPPDAEKHGG
jgi:hypothetical protein